MQALAARTEAKPIAVMGKAIKFSPTRKVVLIPSYRDLSASIVSQRWYTRPDFKIFAETEIERRRSHGISSMSALCSRAEEVPDDDDAPPCELPSERLAAATKIVGFGALVAGCVVPVVLSAGLLAGALDVPRFLWATFGGLAIVFSPVVLVVVHIARNLLRSLHEPDDKYDAAALLARAGANRRAPSERTHRPRRRRGGDEGGDEGDDGDAADADALLLTTISFGCGGWLQVRVARCVFVSSSPRPCGVG